MGTRLMDLGVKKKQAVSSEVMGKRRRDKQVCVGLGGKKEKKEVLESWGDVYTGGRWSRISGLCQEREEGNRSQMEVCLCELGGSCQLPGTEDISQPQARGDWGW